MNILLETERLIVKKPSMDELGSCIDLHMHVDVRRLMVAKTRDADEVKSWLEISMRHQERFGYSVGSVFEKQTNLFIGRAGLIHVENDFHHPDVEIDCYLLPAYWRQGYGLELLQGFFRLGFEKFEMQKIVGIVNKINKPSVELALRAGMQPVGERIFSGISFLWFEKHA